MKKILVAFLTVVLALSLGLVACKGNPTDADTVSITVLDTLELKVGETPDFNGHVKVLVNGVEVADPQVTCKLVNGDPTVAGRCTYRVVYTHNGTDYSKNGFVNFHTDNVVLDGEDFVQRIGVAINWKDHVTVTVNGAAQSNPTLTATVKSGTENVVGNVVYTVKYNYNGVDYSTEITVTYSDVDPDDTDILETLFKKEYNSYTVQYTYYEVEAPDDPIIETDKVVLDETSLFQIHYKDDYSNQDFTYYLSLNVLADSLLHYFNNGSSDAPNWQYSAYSLKNDSDKYLEVLPYGFAPYDCLDNTGAFPVSTAYFTRVSETKFEVKNAYLSDIAEMLFGYDPQTSAETYNKIELETDGTYLTEITAYYTNKQYESIGITFDCVVSYTWSDIDSTTVTLPSDATEYEPYITPDKGQPLSDAQKQAVTEALAKTYNNVTYEYIDLKDDLWSSFSCVGKYSTVATYDFVQQFYSYNGEQYLEASQKGLFASADATKGTYYSFYNENGDYYSQETTSTVADKTWYIAFADFGFTADMFGITEDGTYVITAEALAASDVKNRIFDNIGWGADSFYSTTALLTFTFKLDSSNNVTEWFFVADCVLSNEDGTAGDSFNVQMACNYSEFDTTTIEIPGVFSTTDIADATDINAALEADYSNVTITEHGNNSTMYFVGNDIRVEGYEYDSEGNASGTWNKVYKIKEGNYFEIIGGIETACNEKDDTENCFLYNVLRFDFTLLKDHLKYNAATGTYICHVADFAEYDNDLFAYYWTDFFGAGTTVNDIELTVDNGKVVGVRMYVTVTVTDADTGTSVEMYNTMSATLSDFGTTTIPADTTTD